MRNAFIEELLAAAERSDNIVLVVGDLGFGVVEPFAQRFPKRFLNAGVAEQNMMGLAAGLASEGMHVFVYSIANFPTFRCAEQIRNDVDYHQLPVTVVSVGGGLAYGNLGYSHHAVQDFALMRVMPNMIIASPGDPMEVRACMHFLLKNPQPSYLRLGKAGEVSLHPSVPTVQPGKWVPVKTNPRDQHVCLTSGTVLELAHRALFLQNAPPHISLYSMPLWGMSLKDLQAEQVSRYQRVVTIEDHLPDGGFGSWLLESLVQSPQMLPKVRPLALSSDTCGMVGSATTLNRVGGLTEDAIVKALTAAD